MMEQDLVALDDTDGSKVHVLRMQDSKGATANTGTANTGTARVNMSGGPFPYPFMPE